MALRAANLRVEHRATCVRVIYRGGRGGDVPSLDTILACCRNDRLVPIDMMVCAAHHAMRQDGYHQHNERKACPEAAPRRQL